jgi:hypothetical protein
MFLGRISITIAWHCLFKASLLNDQRSTVRWFVVPVPINCVYVSVNEANLWLLPVPVPHLAKELLSEICGSRGSGSRDCQCGRARCLQAYLTTIRTISGRILNLPEFVTLPCPIASSHYHKSCTITSVSISKPSILVPWVSCRQRWSSPSNCTNFITWTYSSAVSTRSGKRLV